MFVFTKQLQCYDGTDEHVNCVCRCVYVCWSIYRNVVMRQVTSEPGGFVLVTELL